MNFQLLLKTKNVQCGHYNVDVIIIENKRVIVAKTYELKKMVINTLIITWMDCIVLFALSKNSMQTIPYSEHGL